LHSRAHPFLAASRAKKLREVVSTRTWGLLLRCDLLSVEVRAIDGVDRAVFARGRVGAFKRDPNVVDVSPVCSVELNGERVAQSRLHLRLCHSEVVCRGQAAVDGPEV